MEYKFLTFPARPRKKTSLPSSSRRPPLAVLLLQNYDAGNNFSSSSSSSFPRGKGRRNQSTFLSCPERLFLPKRETKKRGEKKFSLFCVEEDQRLAVPRGEGGDSGASDPTPPYKKVVVLFSHSKANPPKKRERKKDRPSFLTLSLTLFLLFCKGAAAAPQTHCGERLVCDFQIAARVLIDRK